MNKLKKFSVPFTVKYSGFPLFWEVLAYDKKEARKITIRELCTDSDITFIATEKHIICLGETKKDNE